VASGIGGEHSLERAGQAGAGQLRLGDVLDGVGQGNEPQAGAGLFVESPAALEMARAFCSAITMVFNSMAFAADSITRTGFDPSTWLPQPGWAFTGGDYSIAVHGDRFVIGESKKIRSFDELSRMLRQ
jgi:roadblock/LC7 domain-containing protein